MLSSRSLLALHVIPSVLSMVFPCFPPATVGKHNPLRTKFHCVAASLATCLQRGGSSRLTHSSAANLPQTEVCRLHALPTAPKTVSMETLAKGIQWCCPMSYGSVVKIPSASAGDGGLTPGWGRSPGGGRGNPLQYSCLESPMDRGTWRATVHGVADSRRQLID